MRDLKFNPNAQDAAAAHLKYRAYVDGLRAVAVLAVLFFHARIGWSIGFHGGYVGVDIFFVISGYLITGLILKDLNVGQFHIVKFWERRIRRILPALAVVVFSTMVAGWFLLLPHGFKELGESASAQSILGANIYFWLDSGYFAQGTEVKPLLHTWSLAVEEQFYLFFPFLLLGLKRLARKSLVPEILLLCGVSFGLSVYCSYFYPMANFYFLHTRAWELLLGAFLAAIPVTSRAPARWLTESLSWGGLLAILCAVFLYDRETRFPGATALLPCVGAALILWTNGQSLTSVGNILALRPVVFIGLISYSLYLWHWPVLVFAKYSAIDPIPLSQRLLLLLASLILAMLSWKFVETPFRQRVILKTRPQIFTFAGVSTTVLLLAGLAIFLLHGVPGRFSAAVLQYANGETDWGTFRNELGPKEALNGDFTELGAGDKHQPINLLVWGDSFAMAVMPVLDDLCKEHSIRGVAATHSGRAPLVGYETKSFALKKDNLVFNKAVMEFIHSKHVGNVLLVANWGIHDTAEESDKLRKGLVATLTALQNSGARIWIMRTVPKQRWDVPRALALAVLHGRNPEEISLPIAICRKELQLRDPIFKELTQKFCNLTVLDPTALFEYSNNLCRLEKDGKALYWDDGHISVAGAMLLRPLFEPIFQGIKKN